MHWTAAPSGQTGTAGCLRSFERNKESQRDGPLSGIWSGQTDTPVSAARMTALLKGLELWTPWAWGSIFWGVAAVALPTFIALIGAPPRRPRRWTHSVKFPDVFIPPITLLSRLANQEPHGLFKASYL